MKELINFLTVRNEINSNEIILKNNQNKEKEINSQSNSIIANQAAQILAETMKDNITDGSSLTTNETQKDSQKLLWDTVDLVCKKKAEEIANKILIIGKDISWIIKNISIDNIEILNPQIVLNKGTNIINIILHCTHNEIFAKINLNMILSKVKDECSIISKIAANILAQTMNDTFTDCSSLTNLNTKNDSKILIWNTIFSKCLMNSKEIIKNTIPIIQFDVISLISKVSIKSIDLIDPNQYLKAGMNIISLILSIGNDKLGVRINVNMILTGVNSCE